MTQQSGPTAYVLVPRPVINDNRGAPLMYRKTLEVAQGGARLIVGRGPSSGINEKRLSRNHIELQCCIVAGRQQLVVCAVGANPSFVLPRGSKGWRELPKDTDYALDHGDFIALLDLQYAYEVMENVATTSLQSGGSDNEGVMSSNYRLSPTMSQNAALAATVHQMTAGNLSSDGSSGCE